MDFLKESFKCCGRICSIVPIDRFCELQSKALPIHVQVRLVSQLGAVRI